MKKPPREVCILYFYTRDATFIRKDLEMLRSRYEVKECSFAASEKWKTPFMFLTQFWFLLRQIPERKRMLIMVQFAGYHSFLPCMWARFTGMKSIVVAGGTDCVAFPSLKYGNFQNPSLALFTRWTYQLCHVVSAVHEGLFYRKDQYYSEAESEQGILQFLPEADFQKSVIFNGFDTVKFRLDKPWQERPELSFLSISASLTDPVRMKLKGIDMVLRLAETMPQASFTLVGSESNENLKIQPNVKIIPRVANEELAAICNRHQYYLQLSISEGFPNALCEAMACACIPIVSAVASMPEISAGFGGIARQRNIASVLQAVEEAIIKSADPELPARISQSVELRYSWERRKEGLLKLIEEIAEFL